MTVYVADAHANAERLDSVVKMAILLERYSTEEQRFVMRFSLWSKRLHAKDIHKEMFPVKCKNSLSRKPVHSWVEKFSQGRTKVADDARPGRLVILRQKRLSTGQEDMDRQCSRYYCEASE
jgi:hypothetical protein